MKLILYKLITLIDSSFELCMGKEIIIWEISWMKFCEVGQKLRLTLELCEVFFSATLRKKFGWVTQGLWCPE